jgi:hypothetical protein
MTDHERKAAAKDALARLTEPLPGQVFRHYKGGYYRVTKLSVDEATCMGLVTYESADYPGPIDTTRTLADFVEVIEVEPLVLSQKTLAVYRPRFLRVEGDPWPTESS